MSSNPAVLIVGAGPTGLVLALSLVQNGVAVRIIDKLSHYRVGRKGHGIQPRTIELHKFIGTLEDFQNLAARPPIMQIYEMPGGTKPAKTSQLFPEKEPTPGVPYPNLMCLGQDKHEEILRAHLEKYGVLVERGTELRSFEQFDDHVLTHLVKTGAEVEETVEFNWLVGTDGANSVVRKGLGIPFEGETREAEFVITGDISVTSDLSRDHWHMWGDFGTKFIDLLPSENPKADLFTFHLSGADPDLAKEKDAIAGSRDLLIKKFYDITGRTDVKFGDLVCISLWRPNVRMIANFGQGSGRVFIAGDAGHTHSPTGGQGLNSCFHDALNLAWKLSLVEKKLAAHSFLDSYSQERVPIIAAMLDKTTALLNKRFKAKGPNDGSSFARGEEAKQLGVNYRGSNIVVDEFAPKDDVAYDPYGAGLAGGPLRAGDRAPDAPGLVTGPESGTHQRLFDIFKLSYHTVIIFSTDTKLQTDVRNILAKYPTDVIRTIVILPRGSTSNGDGVMVDSEGHSYQAYTSSRNAGNEGTIVVVRPDSFIGAIVGGIGGLQTYLKAIFV